MIQESDDYLLAQGNSGQVITTDVTNIPFSSVATLTGSNITFSTSSFSVVESGIYDIKASVYFTTGTNRYLSLWANGNFVRSLGTWSSASLLEGSISLQLTPGITYSIRSSGAAGTLVNDGSVHYLIVTKQNAIKQVTVNADQKAVIPTSELRFEGASARGAVATAIVRFDTVAKLRGDAFSVVSDANNGTAITMLKAGKLDISVSLLSSSTNGFVITRNQTDLTTSTLPASQMLSTTNPSATTFSESLSWSGFVSVGDIIRISCINNPTANNLNNLNLLFQEQEIQVSVSNTLPQFSESDSCVRVFGANGFGSTNTSSRRFSSVDLNLGTDIEYADSATLGSSFTIKSSGIYTMSYSETTNVNGTQSTIAIAKNTRRKTSSK